jgi:hypothetical protein
MRSVDKIFEDVVLTINWRTTSSYWSITEFDCQLISVILQLLSHCHCSEREMSVDDAESMIVLRIFDFVQSDLNVFVQLDDYEKRAFYMSVIIMSSLISRNMRFSFSVADNSCLINYSFFEFFRSLQNHCITLAIDVFIDEAHEIFQVNKTKIFRRESEIHDWEWRRVNEWE